MQINIRVTGPAAAAGTRKTVLNRGSRSDRPRYCVTTTIRAQPWHM